MPGMKDLAEVVGVEVVGHFDDAPLLRWRVVGEVGEHGKWRSRDACATDVLLWDALRAMYMMRAGADAEAETLRDVAAEVQRQLLLERSTPRLTPKGGDRGEFGRQVRRLAKNSVQKADDALEGKRTDDYHVAAGGAAMANRVLVMLGEKPVLEAEVAGEVLERKELVDSLTRVVDQKMRYEPDPGAVRTHGEWREALALLQKVLGVVAGDLRVDEYGNFVDREVKPS